MITNVDWAKYLGTGPNVNMATNDWNATISHANSNLLKY
jgi:hypothetical protein